MLCLKMSPQPAHTRGKSRVQVEGTGSRNRSGVQAGGLVMCAGRRRKLCVQVEGAGHVRRLGVPIRTLNSERSLGVMIGCVICYELARSVKK